MAASNLLLKEPSDTATFRLFCLPYSGCGASMFRAWPEWIGPVEVLPLQLPWRENRMREPHYGTYEALAVEIAVGLAPYLDRDYGVFGHCGGALPAFETALQIAEAGLRPPDRCFVSSQVAPQDGPYGRFLGLTTEQLRDELLVLLAALGSTDPNEGMVDLYLEILEADLEANRRYFKSEPSEAPCPLSVIGWDNDVEVPHRLMGGWAEWADAKDHVLHGGHYSFLSAPADLQNVLRAGLGGA